MVVKMIYVNIFPRKHILIPWLDITEAVVVVSLHARHPSFLLLWCRWKGPFSSMLWHHLPIVLGVYLFISFRLLCPLVSPFLLSDVFWYDKITDFYLWWFLIMIVPYLVSGKHLHWFLCLTTCHVQLYGISTFRMHSFCYEDLKKNVLTEFIYRLSSMSMTLG